MNPVLKAGVILLVGAAIGAAVAGGALTYVKGSAPLLPPDASADEPTVANAMTNAAEVADAPSGDAPPLAPTPRSNVMRRGEDVRIVGSDGPDATVSTDPSVAPPPSPRVRRAEHKAPTVVEEGETPKSKSDGSVRDDDAKPAGSKTTNAADGDGGSIR